MSLEIGELAQIISTGDVIKILGFAQKLVATNMEMYSVQVIATGKILSWAAVDIKPLQLNQTIVDAFKDWNFQNFLAFRRAITHIRVKGELTNILYSMHYGDVEFKPHQYKPVLKFLQGTTGRLLIADEVGLGKTIEALYIWKELQSREDARRLLVVCPHSLTDKWESDMKRLFSITEAETVDAKRLYEKCLNYEQKQTESFALITGIEAIRSKQKTNIGGVTVPPKTAKDKLRAYLDNKVSSYIGDEKVFDLVIIDEAHIVRNYDTCNFKTAEMLRDNAKNVILLSATPIQTSSKNLFNLLRLMEPEEYTNIHIFNDILDENTLLVTLANLFYKRYEKGSLELEKVIQDARVALQQIRESKYFGNYELFEAVARNLEERFTNDELRIKTYGQITKCYFYDGVVSRTRKKDVPGENTVRDSQTVHFSLTQKEKKVYQFVTQRLRNTIRDNSSKVHEFVVMLKQREMASSLPAALIKWSQSYRENYQMSDLYEELFGDDDEDLHEFADTSIPGLNVSLSDLQELKKQDSKYKTFLENVILDRIRKDSTEKIIVFSFFKATLLYLEERLKRDGISALRIDGSITDRTQIIEKFKTENYNILLSSEVGSEGLDLQFAKIEVNYDLPWNPMRLEQRIGRIDRIGQKAEKISIVNMICSDTVEDKILFRLYDRIEVFKKSIGEIEDILGTITTDIQRDLLDPNLTEEQVRERADQLITTKLLDKKLSEELEEKAGISQEYSDSIMNYIEESSRNNRFIRREDLMNYIDDFFQVSGKGSTIVPIKIKGQPDEFRRITLSGEADTQYRDFINNTRAVKAYKYHPGIARDGIDCCFPQGKAISGFVNIDVNDSLIRWIYDTTENGRGKEKPYCFAISIDSQNCPSCTVIKRGVYVFFIKEINFKGMRVRREMFHVVINVNTKEVLSLSNGEYLISQGLFYGEPINNLLKYKDYSAILNSRLDVCTNVAKELYNKAAEEFVENNDTAYKLQVNKANKIFEYQKQIINDAINSLDPLSSYYESTKRLNLGRIEQVSLQHDAIIRRLEKKKEYTTNSEDLATGIIIVK